MLPPLVLGVQGAIVTVNEDEDSDPPNRNLLALTLDAVIISEPLDSDVALKITGCVAPEAKNEPEEVALPDWNIVCVAVVL